MLQGFVVLCDVANQCHYVFVPIKNGTRRRIRAVPALIASDAESVAGHDIAEQRGVAFGAACAAFGLVLVVGTEFTAVRRLASAWLAPVGYPRATKISRLGRRMEAGDPAHDGAQVAAVFRAETVFIQVPFGTERHAAGELAAFAWSDWSGHNSSAVGELHAVEFPLAAGFVGLMDVHVRGPWRRQPWLPARCRKRVPRRCRGDWNPMDVDIAHRWGCIRRRSDDGIVQFAGYTVSMRDLTLPFTLWSLAVVAVRA